MTHEMRPGRSQCFARPSLLLDEAHQQHRAAGNPLQRTPVLVTGGEGMLGSAFAELGALNPRFEIRTVGRTGLDVRDRDAVMAWADWVRDGWIVHCAALVDVQKCAADPDLARQILVEGTRHVADLARASGARLFYPQSFLIYAGGAIDEATQPEPLSLYGEMKWQAEQLIRESVDAPLIVRMAGFFGGDRADKNFVGRIIPTLHKAMTDGVEVFDVGDRVWQPTWTHDLAANSLHLMQAQKEGVYQMASHGEAAFHEIASQIVETLGWGDRLTIRPVSAAAVAQTETGAQRRPDRAVLACERLRRENNDLQRDWRATLNAYLARPFFDQFRVGI